MDFPEAGKDSCIKERGTAIGNLLPTTTVLLEGVQRMTHMNILSLWSLVNLRILTKLNGATFFFFLINLFIYLFLAALGLRCCVLAFSSCGERGLLFVVVRGLLIVVASLVVKHGL